MFPTVVGKLGNKSIDCAFKYANMYRQVHGFNLPHGSHQLPVS